MTGKAYTIFVKKKRR